MRAYLLFLTLLLMTACGGRPAEPAARATAPEVNAEDRERRSDCVREWQQADRGARYRTVGCREDGSFALHVVELDPGLWTIDVDAGPRRAMRDAVNATSARFAINASFFDVDDKAMGALVSGGRVLQKAHPVSWQSIFTISPEGRARIVDRDEWADIASESFAAAQSGPRIVTGGTLNRVKKADPSLRSGVCLTDAGAIRFFVSEPGTYLDVHEVQQLAAKSESDGGIGCHDAMLFDGGPSAQMFLDTPERKISMGGDVVPVYVVAKPRGGAS